MSSSPPQHDHVVRSRGWFAVVEIALITLIFTAQAGWPPPDPNEPHYLGKAKHFWNPDWAARDFFFNSADTHRVFYLTLGWPTKYLELEPLAWCGRLVTWALLAWAWRRLSWTVAPRPGLAVLSGFLFLTLSAGYQLAGEWVVGGFEAKGLAYVLVFLALAEVACDRWRSAFLLLGAASAFHVLVGGWSVVAAGCGWLLAGRERLPLKQLWPALVGGLLLSLPGLLPGLMLDRGVDPQTLQRAHEIYVFERLPHHLLPQSFRAWLIVAQLLMVIAWFALGAVAPDETRNRRIRGVVVGALVIELAGMLISQFAESHPATTAALLRLYWFRLADAMLPVGIALGAAAALAAARRFRLGATAACLAACLALVAYRYDEYAVGKGFQGPPRTDKPGKVLDHEDWKAACLWVAAHTPADVLFLTPRSAQTFTWYAGRGQAASWKDLPQDAKAIVEWRERLEEIYGTEYPEFQGRWVKSLSLRSPARLRELGAKYGADYLLTEADPPLDMPRLYQNNSYAVYKLKSESGHGLRNAVEVRQSVGRHSGKIQSGRRADRGQRAGRSRRTSLPDLGKLSRRMPPVHVCRTERLEQPVCRRTARLGRAARRPRIAADA